MRTQLAVTGFLAIFRYNYHPAHLLDMGLTLPLFHDSFPEPRGAFLKGNYPIPNTHETAEPCECSPAEPVVNRNTICPNRQASRVAQERKRAKRTQFGPGIQTTAGPNVRNEPNSRRGCVGRGLGDEGQTCETNPISRLRIGDRSAAERLPCRLALSACAGRLCKTNPISPERPETGAGGRGRRGRNVRNEPNFESPSAEGRDDCAKQSQTWVGWDI
jgi:hypothetical protein